MGKCVNDVLFPAVTVQLSGLDGNAFAIMGRVRSALQKAKVPKDKITKFLEEAKSGDYDHLLQTCMRWVDCS